MRAVKVGEVKTQLSNSEKEALLVASGLMTLPEQEMDWEAFWALPRPNVSHDAAVQACIDGRGDR